MRSASAWTKDVYVSVLEMLISHVSFVVIRLTSLSQLDTS